MTHFLFALMFTTCLVITGALVLVYGDTTNSLLMLGMIGVVLCAWKDAYDKEQRVLLSEYREQEAQGAVSTAWAQPMIDHCPDQPWEDEDDGRDRDCYEHDCSRDPHDMHVVTFWNTVRELPFTIAEMAVRIDNAGHHKDAEKLMDIAEAYMDRSPEAWMIEPLMRGHEFASDMLDNSKWRGYWVGDCAMEFVEESHTLILRDELFGSATCIDGVWLMSVRPDLVWLAEMYVEDGILTPCVYGPVE